PLANYAHAAAQAPQRQFVTKQRDMMSSENFHLRQKVTAQHGLNSKQRKHVRRHSRADKTLWLSTTRENETVSSLRSESFEYCGLAAPFAEHWRSHRDFVRGVQRMALVEHHELLRILVWQRPHQVCVA